MLVFWRAAEQPQAARKVANKTQWTAPVRISGLKMKTIIKITNNNNWAMTVDIRRKNKGLVIIAVLWMVVVLMVMTAILGRKSRLDMKV